MYSWEDSEDQKGLALTSGAVGRQIESTSFSIYVRDSQSVISYLEATRSTVDLARWRPKRCRPRSSTPTIKIGLCNLRRPWMRPRIQTILSSMTQ